MAMNPFTDDGDMEVVLDEPGTEVVDGTAITPLPDGTIEVNFDPEAPAPSGESENIAELLEDSELNRIAQKICEWTDADEKSRQPWLDAYKEGLRKAALLGAVEATENGGARVVHPLIITAAVQFQARAMEELMPPGGPVKAIILGKSDEELEAQRERVEAHMNWQMTEQDEEYYESCDQMYMHLPLAGCAFKKTYIDEALGYVTSQYIPAEDILMPYNGKSWRRAPRISQIIRYNAATMERLQKNGFYLDQERVKLVRPEVASESDTIAAAADRRDPSDQEEDAEHVVIECHCEFKLSTDEDPMPYIIAVERKDQKTLSIRRNWDSSNDGETIKRRQWFTQFNYLPGLGAYGFGLFHAIGNLAEAATDTLRALLDSAAAANWQGGFFSNDLLKSQKKVLKMKHGEWHGVDAPPEEIAKAFYTPPFREPPQAMFNLLGLLVDAGQTFGSITEQMTGEGNQNMPVGTIVALIEQGSKVYSGIHKRSHASQRHEFKLRARLNHEFISDSGAQFETLGENMMIYKADYDGRVDVVPVSDPNISSTPQRLAIAQAVVERAQVAPDLYDRYEAERHLLRALRVPDIDKILIEKKAVPRLDAATEGARMIASQPVKAYPEQNHQAHIVTHMLLLQQMQGNELIGPAVIPQIVAHIAEHTAQEWRMKMMAAIGVPLPPLEEIDEMEEGGLDPDDEAMVSDAVALAAQEMSAQLQQTDPAQMAAAAEARKIEAEAAAKEIDVELKMTDKEIKAMDVEIKRLELEGKGIELEGRALEAEAAVEQMDMENEIARIEQEFELERQQIEQAAQEKIAKADNDLIKHQMTLEMQREIADLQDKRERDLTALKTQSAEKMAAEKVKSSEKVASEKTKSSEKVATEKNKTSERVAERAVKSKEKQDAKKAAAPKGMKDGGKVESSSGAGGSQPIVIQLNTGGGKRKFKISNIQRGPDGRVIAAEGETEG